MLETVVIGLMVAGERGKEVVREAMERDGVDSGRLEEGYKWFGRKIRWGGLETNKACWVFYMLNRIMESEGC